MPTRSKVAIAATGSVGETMAPRTSPSAQLMLGMTAWAMAATATIVASVSPRRAR